MTYHVADKEGKQTFKFEYDPENLTMIALEKAIIKNEKGSNAAKFKFFKKTEVLVKGNFEEVLKKDKDFEVKFKDTREVKVFLAEKHSLMKQINPYSMILNKVLAN